MYYCDSGAGEKEYFKEFEDIRKASDYFDSLPRPRILYQESGFDSFETIKED
jgi:hypothetical protein